MTKKIRALNDGRLQRVKAEPITDPEEQHRLDEQRLALSPTSAEDTEVIRVVECFQCLSPEEQSQTLTQLVRSLTTNQKQKLLTELNAALEEVSGSVE